ncbi:hypothetical protein LTS18_006186 [Coniosporium uncinatum]|uniref:Uncharacterized protein n=1 Tax=Coniosporium uncinatum TaxID=93489 RepID=A0ACC3DD69_9PEZI|nr:hypothetical protein LTS18_006186 [Coniosporium uncinatum]
MARDMAREAHHKRPHRDEDIDLDPFTSEQKAKPPQELSAQTHHGDSIHQDGKIVFSNVTSARSAPRKDFGELQVPRLLPPVDTDNQDLPPEAVRARLLSTAHLHTLPLPESIAALATGIESARPRLQSKALLPVPAASGNAGSLTVHDTDGSLSGAPKASIAKVPSTSVLPLLKAAVFEDSRGAQAKPVFSNTTRYGPSSRSTKSSGPRYETAERGSIDVRRERDQLHEFAFRSPSLTAGGVHEAADERFHSARPTQSTPKAKSQLFNRISGDFDGASKERGLYDQLDGSERDMIELHEKRASIESEPSIAEHIAGWLIGTEEEAHVGNDLDDSLMDKDMLAISRRRSSSGGGTGDASAKWSVFCDIEWLRARRDNLLEEVVTPKQ